MKAQNRPGTELDIRLRKTSEPGLRGLVPDEDGLVPLEELWKLLQRLGSFKAGDAIAKGSRKKGDPRFVDGLELRAVLTNYGDDPARND